MGFVRFIPGKGGRNKRFIEMINEGKQ